MGRREYHLHDGKRGTALAIRVTPRARKNEIVEILNDGIVRIRLTESPKDGDANELLSNFLSDVLGIARTNIEVVAGENGRDKLVSILNMGSVEAHQKILESIG